MPLGTRCPDRRRWLGPCLLGRGRCTEQTRHRACRRGAPTRRPPGRCVRTNSFRATRETGSLARAPVSLTEEIARMLETEPQNAQPNPEQAGSAGQDSAKEGGQRRGLLRRGRRALKPVGLPAFRSGAAADGQQAGDAASAKQPAAAAAPAARTETPAATGPAVPVVAFQPPVVIFQPPALTGAGPPAEAGL